MAGEKGRRRERQRLRLGSQPPRWVSSHSPLQGRLLALLLVSCPRRRGRAGAVKPAMPAERLALLWLLPQQLPQERVL